MKGWVITVLAVIGGYAVYQWVTQQRGMGAGNRAAASAGVSLGPLGVFAGIQSNVDPTTAGVPTFDQTPIANGHGDQVWAAYHQNPDSTMSGSPQYSPAFGPNENQPTAGEQIVTV
jgi:hypothetical protein